MREASVENMKPQNQGQHSKDKGNKGGNEGGMRRLREEIARDIFTAAVVNGTETMEEDARYAFQAADAFIAALNVVDEPEPPVPAP